VSYAVEVVAQRLAFPEGPVAEPDGSIVLVEVAGGTLARIDPGSGRRTVIADIGGGPNGCHPVAGGGFVVAQNGGFDFGGRVEWFPPHQPVPPGLVLVAADGSYRYLWIDGAIAPNDVAVDAGGVLWLTDPGPAPPEPGRMIGSVLRFDGEQARAMAEGLAFCNGIEALPDGDLAFVEGPGVMRISQDGEVDWVVREAGPAGADGLAVDADGNLYVAACRDHVIRVFDPTGTQLEVIDLPGEGFATNCCFGGADNRTLFVTDGIPGALLAVDGMPVPGLPIKPATAAGLGT